MPGALAAPSARTNDITARFGARPGAGEAVPRQDKGSTDRPTVTARLPERDKATLRRLARAAGKTEGLYVRELIEAGFGFGEPDLSISSRLLGKSLGVLAELSSEMHGGADPFQEGPCNDDVVAFLGTVYDRMRRRRSDEAAFGRMLMLLELLARASGREVDAVREELRLLRQGGS